VCDCQRHHALFHRSRGGTRDCCRRCTPAVQSPAAVSTEYCCKAEKSCRPPRPLLTSMATEVAGGLQNFPGREENCKNGTVRARTGRVLLRLLLSVINAKVPPEILQCEQTRQQVCRSVALFCAGRYKLRKSCPAAPVGTGSMLQVCYVKSEMTVQVIHANMSADEREEH
jgi:hypothetical protein